MEAEAVEAEVVEAIGVEAEAEAIEKQRSTLPHP